MRAYCVITLCAVHISHIKCCRCEDWEINVTCCLWSLWLRFTDFQIVVLEVCLIFTAVYPGWRELTLDLETDNAIHSQVITCDLVIVRKIHSGAKLIVCVNSSDYIRYLSLSWSHGFDMDLRTSVLVKKKKTSKKLPSDFQDIDFKWASRSSGEMCRILLLFWAWMPLIMFLDGS